MDIENKIKTANVELLEIFLHGVPIKQKGYKHAVIVSIDKVCRSQNIHPIMMNVNNAGSANRECLTSFI